MTSYGEALALEGLLPDLGSVYIALFTTLPDAAGSGAVEASGGGYARALYADTWVNDVDDGTTYRSNEFGIAFDVLVGTVADVVGWGIYDAASGGNLLAFGPMLDVDGDVITQTFSAGEIITFDPEQLSVGIGDE